MLGRRGRRILLENCFDLHVVVRHGELVVLDGHAAADDLPLLEVVALVWLGGQGDFRTDHRFCMRGGSRSVSVRFHGDCKLGGCRGCILLEDGLDRNIGVRHGELVVGDYKSCRRFDLPLLEVIALVGRCAQGDLRTGRSLCGRGGSRSVAAAGHGDGMLGRRGRRILLENCFDLHITVRHGELIVLDSHIAAHDLPLLEVVTCVGRCGQGDLRTDHGFYMRGGSRSVSVRFHGDGVLDMGGRCVLP